MMTDLPDNVRFTWQLVSQFVSWEFCRYMSENNENNSETDVLSFLRNMVVQRTEKSVSEVTKHEIIAKFIMEIKAINNFQVESIIPLSESVKKICPELSSAVSTLVHHLETFFGVLECTDESRKELIQVRIEDAISDFSKEASRLLPEPDLIQVVNSWSENHHHHHHLPHAAKPLKKSIYNPVLFEKVLECIHFEGITPEEARFIAVALNADEEFSKIFQCGEAEPETEADSEQFTFSQSSQPVYSQEFAKNTQASKEDVNPLNHKSPNHQVYSHAPLPVDTSPLQISDGSPVQFNDLQIMQPEDPPDFLDGTPPSPPPSPPDYPFLHRNISNKNRDVQLQESASHMQFAQSSSSDLNENDADLYDRIQDKFQQIHERQNQSDSDTSDCDKSQDIKFLTPTYFKEGRTDIIYLSDVESHEHDSSILTNVPSSQQADPNWSRGKSFLPATQYARPSKRKKRRNSPVKKKKPARLVPSSDSDNENWAIPPSRNLRHHNIKSGTCARNALGSSNSPSSSAPCRRAELDDLVMGSRDLPSTSTTRTRAELKGPLKKRHMSKALYRSPTSCIEDFVSVLRRPNSESLSSDVTVPEVIKPKKTKKPPALPSGWKGTKCKHCNRTYKTTVALRRHIFLKHTEPPGDSDCDI